MITMALMHLAMIPLAYLLEFFPFLNSILENSMELILKLAELAR